MRTYTGKYSGTEAKERNTLARYDQLVLELEDGSEIAFPGSRQYVQEQSQSLTLGDTIRVSVDEANIWNWHLQEMWMGQLARQDGGQRTVVAEGEYDVKVIDISEAEGGGYIVTYVRQGETAEMKVSARVIEDRNRGDVERFISEHLELSSPQTKTIRKTLHPSHPSRPEGRREHRHRVADLVGLTLENLAGGIEGFRIELHDGKEAIFGWANGPIGYVVKSGDDESEYEDMDIENPTPEQEAIWIDEVMKYLDDEYGVDAEYRHASYGSTLKLSQNDEGMEVLAISNRDVIERFFDGITKGRTQHLYLEERGDGVAIVNYSTPLAYRDSRGNVYFNEQGYSITTSKIQSWILGEAARRGIIMDVVPNDRVLYDIMGTDYQRLKAPKNVRVINVREEEGKYIVEYMADGIEHEEREVGKGLLKDMNIRELEKYIETPPDRDFTAMKKSADGSSTTPLYEATCPGGHKFEITPGEIAMAGGAVCPKCGKKCQPKYEAKSIRERANL